MMMMFTRKTGKDTPESKIPKYRQQRERGRKQGRKERMGGIVGGGIKVVKFDLHLSNLSTQVAAAKQSDKKNV